MRHVFVVSSIIFLHTSAPIWGEDQYCQSQYEARGNNTYSFEYGELERAQVLQKITGIVSKEAFHT